MNKRSSWALPYFIFMVLFVVLPLLMVVIYSFQDSAGNFSMANFSKFITDKDSLSTFALSIEVAIENTLLCVIIGYPVAYILADKKLNKSAVTVVLFILPMWVNAGSLSLEQTTFWAESFMDAAISFSHSFDPSPLWSFSTFVP